MDGLSLTSIESFVTGHCPLAAVGSAPPNSHAYKRVRESADLRECVSQGAGGRVRGRERGERETAVKHVIVRLWRGLVGSLTAVVSPELWESTFSPEGASHTAGVCVCECVCVGKRALRER